MRHLRPPAILALACAVALGACSGSDGDTDDVAAGTSSSTSTPAPAVPLVFSGQGNDLVAYSTEEPFTRQVVIEHNSEENPDGLDINGQICFDPDDPQRFVAGEDTFQATTGSPGWGVFALTGATIGELSATQLAELVPTYQPGQDGGENFGCGFLDDGRIVTTDIGNQAAGDPNGQLIVWFPPFEGDAIAYCKVDVTLGTAQSILVDGGWVYVASARGGGVLRYDIAALPTSATAAGGCDATDATGAPLASGVEREQFIVGDDQNGIATAAGIAKGADGTLFVSSVFNGVISEFDADGTFLRRVLEPPAGEALGTEPFSTGTPLGIAVGPDGTLYYADIGIVIDDGIGPGRNAGSVRRIRFAGGAPQPPEVLDDGLAFPDAVGIFRP